MINATRQNYRPSNSGTQEEPAVTRLGLYIVLDCIEHVCDSPTNYLKGDGMRTRFIAGIPQIWDEAGSSRANRRSTSSARRKKTRRHGITDWTPRRLSTSRSSAEPHGRTLPATA